MAGMSSSKKPRRSSRWVQILEQRRLLSYATFDLAATYAQPDGVGGNGIGATSGLGGGTALVLADVNGDGRLDIITVNGDQGAKVDSSIYVRLGDGTGKFGDALKLDTGRAAEAVVVADINGDGKPDLLTANARSSDVSILLGNGDGTFRARTNLPISNDPRALVVADFNGDNIADLAIAEEGTGDTGGDVIILQGNNDGTFSNFGEQHAVSGLPQGLVAGDFDSNGTMDIVAVVAGSDLSSGAADILLNDGSATFTVSPIGTLYGVPSAAVAVDLNNDRAMDLAVSTNAGVELFFGLGDGRFTDDALVTDGAAGGVAAADFNGDGRADLISGAKTGPLAGLSGSSRFFLAPTKVVGGVSQLYAVGDLNGDGLPDFAAASTTRNAIDVFLTSILPGTPLPPAIGGLDPGFGDGSGKVVTTIPMSQLTSIDTAIVQQGELLVAGLDLMGNQVVLTRYFKDGSADQGFGGAAGTRVHVPDGFTASRVVFDQSVNQVMILGTITKTRQPAAVLIAPGGYVDESFGNNGVLVMKIFRPGDEVDSVVGVKNADGIVTSYVVGGRAKEGSAFHAVVAKVSLNGATDSHFGSKGVYVVSVAKVGAVDAIESLTIDAKGAIYAAGTASSGNVSDGSLKSKILVLKLTPSGRLDTTFGQTVYGFKAYGLAAGQKIFLQRDGKVVVSGDVAVNETGARENLVGSVLVRFTTAGVLDKTFNNGGTLVVTAPPPQPSSRPQSLRRLGGSGEGSATAASSSLLSGFGDFLSNRLAAGSAVSGGKLAQTAAQASASNTVLTQSQIVADAVDLKVTAVTLGGQSPYKAKSKGSAAISLANIGTLSVPAVKIPVTLYFSTDRKLDTAGDVAVHVSSIKAALKPGTSATVTVLFTYPSGVGSGPLYLFAVVDGGGTAFSELTLADNSARTGKSFLVDGH